MYIPLVLTEEHAALEKAVGELLRRRFDEAALRSVVDRDQGYDPALWQQLRSMGLPSLTIPEQYGGSGFGRLESFLLFREMGRVLLASHFFATVALAANVVMQTGTADAKADILPQIAEGTLTATVACCAPSGSWNPADIELAVHTSSEEVRLTGTTSFVPDAHTARLILVVARTAAGLGVFAVEPGAAGLHIERLETLDQSRPLGTLNFADTRVVPISGSDDATDGIRRALAEATLALVAEQVGGGEFLLRSAIDYAKLRHQFGRPIGSFQAIKHKLAEMTFDLERMVSAAWRAANIGEDESTEYGRAIALAKAYCSDAYFRLAAEHIQVHGGIGFTWEHVAHLYFRRAKSSALMLGAAHVHREELLDALLRDSEAATVTP
jgi:alkylation response protein AidB-like acyl-CoA dehydrogenase